MQGATTDDEPMGRNPGTSEAANLTALKVRGCDLAPRFPDLIEASGHVPCFKAVHMNAPSTRVKSIEKLLAPRAVPHMRFVMSKNRGVVYTKPGEAQVQDIADPKLENPQGRKIDHGVILKVVSTNICGSDQHMVRGRTTAPAGMVLGHEITGEVIEKGSDVEMLDIGDLVTVPFNIACGRCRNCREGKTGICLTVNPARPGAAYGYVDMGGWVGGQAEYVMVPYADFNLLKFPNKERAMAKIRDLTLLSDIFPTGFHGAVTAGVTTGSIVYVAGAGPGGWACAAPCHLLGAAVVIVGDMIPERLAQAKSFGCETIDLRKDASLADQIE